MKEDVISVLDQGLNGSAFETFNRIIETLQAEEQIDLADPAVRAKLEELKLLLVDQEQRPSLREL